MKVDLELDNARKADDADPLACFRERFLIPKRTRDAEVTYLRGNSLGLQLKPAGTLVSDCET
jgi:kynureninase